MHELRTTATAREHLVAHSRWYLGPYYPKLADRPIARDLIEILRSGAPARFASRPDEADWHRAMETETFAEEFTAAMNTPRRCSPRRRWRSSSICRGISGCSTSPAARACSPARSPSAFPHLRASVLEKAPVDRIAARDQSRTAASADRVDTVVGDMLAEPLPDGYDVHLFSNVLHDWDEDVVRQLLAASAAALRRGGLLIVHDTFLNATKTGPLAIAEYSVLLMHVTQGRCYSVAEIESWLVDCRVSPSAASSRAPSAAARSWRSAFDPRAVREQAAGGDPFRTARRSTTASSRGVK